MVDGENRDCQPEEGQSCSGYDPVEEHTADDRPECVNGKFAGVFDSGVNTNDGPGMAVCQFAAIADAETEIVDRMMDSHEVNKTQPESSPPTIDPNVSMKNPPEYLTPVSTPMTALAWLCVNLLRLPTVKTEFVNRMKDSRKVNMTQPESTPPTIDPNVSMKNWEDGVCHLLIYADDFPQDILKTNSRNPQAANMQHEAYEIYTDRTASRTRRSWDDARTWEFRNAQGNTNVNLSQNSRMEINREYVSDVDTDTASDAELDYEAKKCASRTWKCCCALADVPPAEENPEMCEHEEWIIRNEHSPWICANHQHGWDNTDRQIYDSIDIAEWSPITTNCLNMSVGDSSRTWEFRNARGNTNVNLSQNSRMEMRIENMYQMLILTQTPTQN